MDILSSVDNVVSHAALTALRAMVVDDATGGGAVAKLEHLLKEFREQCAAAVKAHLPDEEDQRREDEPDPAFV